MNIRKTSIAILASAICLFSASAIAQAPAQAPASPQENAQPSAPGYSRHHDGRHHGKRHHGDRNRGKFARHGKGGAPHTRLALKGIELTQAQRDSVRALSQRSRQAIAAGEARIRQEVQVRETAEMKAILTPEQFTQYQANLEALTKAAKERRDRSPKDWNCNGQPGNCNGQPGNCQPAPADCQPCPPATCEGAQPCYGQPGCNEYCVPRAPKAHKHGKAPKAKKDKKNKKDKGNR